MLTLCALLLLKVRGRWANKNTLSSLFSSALFSMYIMSILLCSYTIKTVFDEASEQSIPFVFVMGCRRGPACRRWRVRFIGSKSAGLCDDINELRSHILSHYITLHYITLHYLTLPGCNDYTVPKSALDLGHSEPARCTMAQWLGYDLT